MKNIFKNKKININYLLAFLIPIIGMLIIFIIKSIYPFGDRSFLRTDMYHQYAPFFSEFQYKLQNGESLFYTWNVGLGTNFLTIIAYYIACPFNFLLFIIPKKYVIEFMTYLIVFKMGIMSLSMTYYLNKHFKKCSLLSVIFGILYSLSAYIAAYSWNIMWLDVIILFPLTILGLEKIVYETNKNNKKYGLLYTITLALTILSNYYISIMVCMFLVIYFIVLNIVSNEKRPQVILRRFCNFTFYSIIAGLLSGVLLIPVIFAFKTIASSKVSFPKTWSEYFPLVDMLTRHLPFVDIENGLEHWPNIFCGSVILMLVSLYFLEKKISIKEKITYLVLVLFLLYSFSLNILNFIWHGFHYPNSLPARQSFIYVFIVLYVSYKAVIKYKNTKNLAVSYAISMCFILIAQITVLNSKMHFYSYLFSLLFITIYFILFYQYRIDKKNRNIFLYLVLIFISIECIFNMGLTSITTCSRKIYLEDTEDILNLKNAIKENELDFYRIERIERKTKDDGAFLNFPSASIFSSSAYKAGSDFFKKIGCEAAMNAYSITGSTPLANSLFSIKYAFYNNEVKNALDMSLEQVNKSNNIYLYENKHTLPFSYLLEKEDIDEFDFSSANPATIQNNFSKTFGGEKYILNKIEINEDTKKVSFNIEEAGEYYVFVRDLGIEEIKADIAGRMQTFKNIDRAFFLELGYLDEGKKVILENMSKDAKDLKCEVFRFDHITLARLVNNIKMNSNFSLKKWTSNNIQYDFEAKKNGVAIISTPFDKGWTIYVDNKKVDTYDTFNFFTSFDIEEGKHNIKMIYEPEGFKLGLLASCLGIFLLFLKQNLHHIIRKRSSKSQ